MHWTLDIDRLSFLSFLSCLSLFFLSQASLNESLKTRPATRPACAAVSLFTSSTAQGHALSSDIVAEQNVFECPVAGLQNSSGYHMAACQECVTRP